MNIQLAIKDQQIYLICTDLVLKLKKYSPCFIKITKRVGVDCFSFPSRNIPTLKKGIAGFLRNACIR